MSTSSPSLQPLQPDHPHESQVFCEDSLSLKEQNPNQLDPLPKSDPETLPNALLLPDPEVNSPEEEEEEEEEGDEVDEGQEQETPAVSSGMSPISDPNVLVSDVALASPSGDPNTRRGANKRKKGKGKGKGKPNIKKKQAIEEKVQTLITELNPIPFLPQKIFDFAKHEKLLKKLGLWDYVQIDFDRSVRVDLIAQLVATYEAKLRASYVDGFRIRVNRADLARALKLPSKKEKGNVGGVEVDLDCEALSDESIGFIVEFVLDWVLLHEDTWMMPNEVTEWLKVIKDGHPEKVDWAGLLWFMVEKELKQGAKLRDCYYASHLQHLIKFQREELFLREEPAAEAVELDADVKEKEDEVNEGGGEVSSPIDGPGVRNHEMEGPSTELTLGQDGEKEEGITKEVDMMDVEKCKESDDEEEGEEQGQWLLHGKKNTAEHFMQPCGAENLEGFGSFEDRKEEDEGEDEEEEEEEEEEEMDADEDEEEAGNKFHVFPNDNALEGDGFTGNLLQAMEANHIAFNSVEQLRSTSSMDTRADMQHIASTHSFFNNAGKSVMEHDNHISHHSLNGSNKRLRINDSWDHKPVDFGMCMENIQQMTERAKALYEEKEQALEQSNMNQQILLAELQKRDNVIEHLHKARVDEIQKKDGEIYRLERELYLMGSVLDGYRKALKETQKVFAEYRERAQLPEEPTYRDAGPGGLMLTAVEIEKRDKKQEEENKMNCMNIEQKMSEVEADYSRQFDGHVERINLLDKKLTGLEASFKMIVELNASRKIPETEVPEVVETQSTSQTEEKVDEVAEPLPSEEKLPEVAEPLPSPQTEEKVHEVA